MKNNTHFEDDGRTIVNMNVEGMPWYTPNSQSKSKSYLSNSELFKIVFSATLAALAVSLIFSISFILIILFCLKVWFKV